MDKDFIFKTVVKVISTIIFFFQLNFSIQKLINPPLTDVSLTTSLSAVDQMPLITICPLNQINESKVKELGYKKTSHFLKGVKVIGGKEQLSWGADLNKTFDEMMDLVLDVSAHNYSGLHVNELKKTGRIIDKYTHKLLKKFDIGIWGYCWELEEYNTTTALEFYFTPSREFRTYIADKNMNTFYRTHEKSMTGKRILTNSDYRVWFEISIRKISQFDPNNPDNCVNYKDSMLARCVDDQVQRIVKPQLGCNVPWMSGRSQCEHVVNITEIKAYHEEANLFVYGEDIPLEDNCPQSCNTTIFTARIRNSYSDNGYSVKISFAQEVSFTKKLLTYDFSNFLVDIGT